MSWAELHGIAVASPGASTQVAPTGRTACSRNPCAAVDALVKFADTVVQHFDLPRQAPQRIFKVGDLLVERGEARILSLFALRGGSLRRLLFV